MREYIPLYFILWDNFRTEFRYARVEVAPSSSRSLLKRKLAFANLGDALKRVGELNHMLDSGFAEDHFVVPERLKVKGERNGM